MTTEQDLIIPNKRSNCCGARVYLPDVCSACRDHCEAVSPYAYEIQASATFQLIDQVQAMLERVKELNRDEYHKDTAFMRYIDKAIDAAKQTNNLLLAD